MSRLLIKNLTVSVNQKTILHDINLEQNSGSLDVIMGANGTGKSTLCAVLAGKPGYEVTEGSIEFEGTDLLSLSPEERAHAGVFLSFQNPIEIPGVSNLYFLKTALNEILKSRGEPELDSVEFLNQVKQHVKLVGLDQSFLYRPLNEGFSGGEKKRNEILQMMILKPKLAILDETDSGLDIDALKLFADRLNQIRDTNRSFLVITHYRRLLDYIKPDKIHVLNRGTITHSGDMRLVEAIEKNGYEGLDAIS